ncbi:hypothetical protein UlMin_022448, partial [Ulmus minor]
MILPSTEVFHGSRLPIAVLTVTSSSSSAPTILASLVASLGFWDSVVDTHNKIPERDFSETPYVPVYVMLRLGVINVNCELVDPEALINELKILKSLNVDGVMVDCWWGIVEARSPQVYNWDGYRRLFQIVRDLNLKLKVYYDYMRSFRSKFNDFFEDGIISEVECYEKYLMKSLTKAAEVRGHLIWASGPNDAGAYNSTFFLNWYSRTLVDHGDLVLTLANFVFKGTCITAKLPGIHWWYKTANHAAELTAGFYNYVERDGYAPIAAMLKKNKVAMNFTCAELCTMGQHEHEHFPNALADQEGLGQLERFPNALADPERLGCISVTGENALPCYDQDGYNKIAENAKPFDDPLGRHLSAFTYLGLSSTLMEMHNIAEFEHFVKNMHGLNIRSNSRSSRQAYKRTLAENA